MFEVNASGVPNNLKMEFLDLNPTFGHTTVPTNLTFYSIDFTSKYSLSSIDALSLADFRKRLEADKDTANDYLVRTLGFNPSNSSEYNQAMNVWKDQELVTSKGNYDCFICQMHKSIDSKEMEACCSGNSAAYELFLQ